MGNEVIEYNLPCQLVKVGNNKKSFKFVLFFPVVLHINWLIFTKVGKR